MEEGFLVLDDLDGDLALLHLVVGLHHLPEGALPDQRVYLVPGNKGARVNLGLYSTVLVRYRVGDPHLFDPHPDPAFQADYRCGSGSNPDPGF
jgi:hypothetical protein